MQKNIADPGDRAAIVARLQKLSPDSRRQWGRMTPHQAICHLNDSFRSVTGSRPISLVRSPLPLPRSVMKWIALQSPMRWPHGIKTRPEVDQEVGGTRPVEFTQDKRVLEATIDQFATRSGGFQSHPMFGPMTTGEWQRWGYLHLDHHLRQFGV